MGAGGIGCGLQWLNSPREESAFVGSSTGWARAESVAAAVAGQEREESAFRAVWVSELVE